MHLLNIITITSAGLMVGNELSVSAFVNPALRRLESGPQAQALSVLARSLGRAMPVWYGLCLALLALESFLHFHQTTRTPLLIAAALWAFDPMAVGFNRIAKEDTFVLFFFLLGKILWLHGQRIAETKSTEQG